MLAQLGRGYSVTAQTADKVELLMTKLFKQFSAAVLSDTTLGIQTRNTIELYPAPIPDLYLGSPVVSDLNHV